MNRNLTLIMTLILSLYAVGSQADITNLDTTTVSNTPILIAEANTMSSEKTITLALNKTSVKKLSNKQIAAMLPEDADKTNIPRQRKAIKIGFYWSKSRKLIPLGS
ncbi:MAG: hypothetical protein MI864_10075 [Pseudomonadales bacterium]|uniref:Uncharacterized protein n=1 Tax=Oleiphilus messinensis TaxID=141451 RepID=A0A1Y0I6G6_9GAMM|nr:hypothetical protein [Oleiphilus messinensis]ARU55024.1 hypothetical protein OLMES_0937 [Oleiphilus messinensis]MCG8610868.1 hypothetical protein [Pseudomonadales bacterium]